MEEVSRGELKDLNAELLAEVFSFLPSEDLLEVMLVSKHWERSATEGSGLCQRVTVDRAWEMGGGGGKGHNFMCKLLAAAKEVEFKDTYGLYNGHIESLGGVLGSNLRFLQIPDDSVSSAFLSILLSHCPNLKTFMINGEPKGRDPIVIRHPQLETLKIDVHDLRALTIECPNLTHLSTGDTFGRCGLDTLLPPSFTCPRLTNLMLSFAYSSDQVLQFFEGHAPNIKWLQVHCCWINPLLTLTRFKALRVLRVKAELRGTPPLFDFCQWPLLEGIFLDCSPFPTDPEVRHAHLKELIIVNRDGLTSLVLDCPSLEKLQLYDVTLTKNLDSLCPRLRSFKQDRDYNAHYGGGARCEGSLEFVHETVEELECRNVHPQIERIACPKLTKLVLGYQLNYGPQLAFPVVECLNLLRLELYGCARLESSLPSVLAVLPHLETLKIGELGDWKDAILEHSRIKDLVLDNSLARSLVLIMPSLVHVDIGDTELDVLKVASMEKTITVDFRWSWKRVDRRRRVFGGGVTRIVDLSDAM